MILFCFWCDKEHSGTEGESAEVDGITYFVCNECVKDQLSRGIKEFLERYPSWIEALDENKKEIVN